MIRCSRWPSQSHPGLTHELIPDRGHLLQPQKCIVSRAG